MPGDVSGRSHHAKAGEFEFREGPVSTDSSWPTRSTARLRRRRPPCSRPWRSGSVDGRRHAPAAGPLPRRRDAEPHRARRHVHAAEAQLDRFLLSSWSTSRRATPNWPCSAATPSGSTRGPRRGGSSTRGDRGGDPCRAAGRGIRHRLGRRARLHRRPRACHPAQPLGAAGRQPSCRHGAAGRVEGVGVARRYRDHAGPRADAARADLAAPGALRADAELEECRSTPSSVRCCSRPACPSDTTARTAV